MGVKGLWDIAAPGGREASQREIVAGKVVAIGGI